MTRKNQTNIFLRECMGIALLELLEKNELSEISVTQITELANVGRATFYRNFSTKEELLIDYLCNLFYKWEKSHNTIMRWTEEDTNYSSDKFFKMIISFLEFIESIKNIIQLLVKRNLFQIIIQVFLTVYDITHEKINYRRYKNIFASFGISGIAIAWVMTGMQETPQELADILINKLT